MRCPSKRDRRLRQKGLRYGWNLLDLRLGSVMVGIMRRPPLPRVRRPFCWRGIRIRISGMFP